MNAGTENAASPRDGEAPAYRSAQRSRRASLR